MAESTNDHTRRPYPDSETALGGADAVEKTTYVVGEGTDPNAHTPEGHPPSVGNTRSSALLWLVFVLAIVIAVVYTTGVIAR
jgi:hypothetical protein